MVNVVDVVVDVVVEVVVVEVVEVVVVVVVEVVVVVVEVVVVVGVLVVVVVDDVSGGARSANAFGSGDNAGGVEGDCPSLNVIGDHVPVVPAVGLAELESCLFFNGLLCFFALDDSAA